MNSKQPSTLEMCRALDNTKPKLASVKSIEQLLLQCERQADQLSQQAILLANQQDEIAGLREQMYQDNLELSNRITEFENKVYNKRI